MFVHGAQPRNPIYNNKASAHPVDSSGVLNPARTLRQDGTEQTSRRVGTICSRAVQRAARQACAIAALAASAASFAETPQGVFARVSSSVVVVRALNAAGWLVAQGSGVVLSSRGDVVTNCHVVGNGLRVTLQHARIEYPAQLTHADWGNDLCLLSAPGLSGTPAARGKTSLLNVGSPVYAVGAPLGLELSLSDGLVSSLRETVDASIIQTTAAISKGSSGGGLFDSAGRLVGITSYYMLNGQNLNFAIPVERVEALLERRYASRAGPLNSNAVWLATAIELERTRDWEGLRRHSWSRLSRNGDSAGAWAALGQALSRSNAHDRAIEAYRRALALDAGQGWAWTNLSHTYSSLGRHEAALATSTRALLLNPEASVVWHNLGVAYYGLGRYSEAVLAFHRGLERAFEAADIWMDLGSAYAAMGRHEDALGALQRAVRSDASSSTAWHRLGKSYAALAQSAEAIRALEHTVHLVPYDSTAWNDLGVANASAKRFEAAIRAFREALRIRPERPGSWSNLSRIYALLGRHDEARWAFARAVHFAAAA
ncbi:MAG: tetratricopeptide repeat protein [Gammaproteobacteria bacterium]